MKLILPLVLYFSAFLRVITALGPWQHFQTEPTFRTCIFNITTNIKPDLQAPGYIWLTPYVLNFDIGSFGPQIYTTDGELVWNGNDSVHVRAIDAHVCDYAGESGNHICMNDARPTEQGGHSSGVIRFFDNTYSEVALDYGAAGGLRGPDIHELNTPALGYSFLQDVYEIRQMDLEPFLGPKNGYVLDGCFQEIDTKNGEVLFQWCALDYVDIADTHLYLHVPHNSNYTLSIAGNGTKEQPWDWMHINSIDKNMEGDYIVSARHLDTIFKIAGLNSPGRTPGEIIWRLGGKKSDFKLEGFSFSRQHTVRFVSTSRSRTLISLFNNNFDGWAHPEAQTHSDGQLIKLDNITMVARRVRSYPMPYGKMASSQGSMQILNNTNIFMGWGNLNYFSEHTLDGELLYHVRYSGGVQSFRVWKFPWIGHPRSKPKILAYAFDAQSPLYAYLSWNGATDVAAWNLYTSDSTAHGPWHIVGIVPKAGFETFANLSALAPTGRNTVNFSPYMYAEALNDRGEVLGTTRVVETFLPKDPELHGCGETLCAEQWFSYAVEHSKSRMVPRTHSAGVWALLFLIFVVELAHWPWRRVCSI